MKISKMFRTAVTIKITKKESAMKDKVVDCTLQFGYIGTVAKYDMTALMGRAFVLVKKALESKQKFKFYSTIKLWSRNNHAFKPDVFSGDFTSNETSKWLDQFIKRIQDVIQSDDQIVLRQSILKFHIVFQPEGAGCATDSTKRESIFKKTSVVQIKNDDNNCFWYALAVAINKDNKDMKNNARPKKRNMFGEQLCHKTKLQWDEPVSFVFIPLVEEALNINIYVIDLDNLPVLGAAINLWDCLT